MSKAELKTGQLWRTPKGSIVTISAIYPGTTRNVRVKRVSGSHYWVSVDRFNNKPNGYQYAGD